jgi:hypothetical protein
MTRFVVLLVGAMLAAAAAASAFSAAGEATNPALAARVFPLNGDARAEQAMRRYEAQMRKARDPAAVPDPVVHALAVEAYRREPLNLDAAFILLRGAVGMSDEQRTAALDAAYRLSRRSTPISFDLLTAHSRAGNTAGAIGSLDSMLRRQTPVHGQLLTFLSGLVGDRATHRDFVALLSSEPEWAGQFWRQLAQTPAGLKGALPLWQQVKSAGIATDPELDALLVSGLAGQGLFDDSQAMARRVSALDWGAGLRNDEFSRLPDVMPFDWQLSATGDYGAEIAADREALIVSALSGSRGVVARQIVRLDRPEYRLVARLSPGGPPPARSMLRARVDCLAPAAEGVLLEAPLSVLPNSFGRGACRWAQVSLNVAVPEAADGQEWSVERLQLRPVVVAD